MRVTAELMSESKRADESLVAFDRRMQAITTKLRRLTRDGYTARDFFKKVKTAAFVCGLRPGYVVLKIALLCGTSVDFAQWPQ